MWTQNQRYDIGVVELLRLMSACACLCASEGVREAYDASVSAHGVLCALPLTWRLCARTGVGRCESTVRGELERSRGCDESITGSGSKCGAGEEGKLVCTGGVLLLMSTLP